MHSFHEHMLGRLVFRAGLTLGFLLVLTSCGDVVDKAGSVRFGKGVDTNSDFEITVSQMTLTLSALTLTDDGGLAHSTTITNQGATELCATTHKEGNEAIINLPTHLLDRTGRYRLDLYDPNTAIWQVSTNGNAATNTPASNPNYVFPAKAKVTFYWPRFPFEFLRVFLKREGGRERDYRPSEQLTARAHIMVFPCKYSDLTASRKTGEYAEITSQLVGPFKVLDEILFGKQAE